MNLTERDCSSFEGTIHTGPSTPAVWPWERTGAEKNQGCDYQKHEN